MVQDRILSPLGHASSVDEATLTARGPKPARAASWNIELPSDVTSTTTPERQSHRSHERAPTTPTTPTFVLSGAKGCDGEPLLLSGWSRSKASEAKAKRQRASLHNPSTMLSDDSKTDVVSLASYVHEKGGMAAPRATSASTGLFCLPLLPSLLNTRKGRRGFANSVRAWTSLKSIVALVLALVVLVRMLFSPSPPLERGVDGRLRSHKSTDTVFLSNWIDHVVDHPVRARDKTGFAEMGLRTEMYAHLLRHHNVPDFDRMERALWPFVPGINQLRKWWQASVQAKPHEYAAVSASSHPQQRESFLSRGFGSGPLIQHGSKGIVMSLGHKGSVFASQFISIVREKHHNNIPIELYYYGDSDLPAKYRDYLTKTYRNVRCVDLESLGLFDPELVQLERQGFAIKPFALLATNFTEVILADADAILLEDPDHFFDEPGYLETGTLFFHDRDHLRAGTIDVITEFMDNQLSLRGPSPRLASSGFWQKKGIFEQESGIVVVDKRKTDVFAALLFTAWQNMGEIRKKTTYRVWWGDKETFWLAFEFSNFPYYFVPRYAQAIGTTRTVSKAEQLQRALKAQAKDGKAKAKEPAAAAADDNAAKDGRKPAKEAAGEQAEAKAEPPALSEASFDEQEEFCSEHPLHFLGADIEDHPTDNADPLKLGRPAWFNGGILDVKTLSDEIYLQPNAFTLDGAWQFLFDEEAWCIRNYTLGDLASFDLTHRIEDLKSIARKAETRFYSKIPKAVKSKADAASFE